MMAHHTLSGLGGRAADPRSLLGRCPLWVHLASIPRCPSYVSFCSETGDKAVHRKRSRQCPSAGNPGELLATPALIQSDTVRVAQWGSLSGQLGPLVLAVFRLITSSNYRLTSCIQSSGKIWKGYPRLDPDWLLAHLSPSWRKRPERRRPEAGR